MSGTRTTQAEKRAAVEAFYDYVRSVIAEKRKNPGDDLITELLARGELTDEELAGVTWFLFSAGHDTTSQSFAYMTYYLLYEPERWQAVRTSGASVDQVVEELLRYLPVFRFSIGARTALEDVDLGGYVVKAGEPVTVHLNVLNRDPKRFDHPDECDPERDSRGHMQFGFGRHMCLGQHLARLELQVELAGVMERFPTLRLAVPRDAVSLVPDGFVHGYVVELPVAW
jgi:cytochrome P450